jgi:hypothetical protein
MTLEELRYIRSVLRDVKEYVYTNKDKSVEDPKDLEYLEDVDTAISLVTESIDTEKQVLKSITIKK